MRSQREIWNKEYSKNKDKWHKETVKLPIFLKGKKVLELGVGNGKTLKAILKQKTSKVVCIDFSKEAVDIVNKNFEEVKCINADVRELPFRNEEFDYVVCYYVLNNLLHKDREKAAREILRVLKKDGKILFEDFHVGDYRQKGNEMEDNTIMNNKGIICHFFNEKELRNIFSDFSKINLEIKERYPIRKNKKIKRKIISGIFTK